jgi:hypothetical protein
VSVGLCGSIDTHDGNCLPLLPSSGSGSFMSPPPSPSSWTIIALSWVLPPWDVLYVVFPSLACPDRLILLSGFHARTITVWCCAGGPQLEPTRGVPRCTRPIHSPSTPPLPSSLLFRRRVVASISAVFVPVRLPSSFGSSASPCTVALRRPGCLRCSFVAGPLRRRWGWIVRSAPLSTATRSFDLSMWVSTSHLPLIHSSRSTSMSDRDPSSHQR